MPFNPAKSLQGVLAFVSILVLSDCANIVPLTGGDKDARPPKLISSVPENFSINFMGNKIVFGFDEFMQTREAQTQVVVSPPLKYPIEYFIKGKRLQMKFKDTLEPNTTYNINFGKALGDITEGNIVEMPNFIFSTGSHIDSLSIKGEVSDALTGENMVDVLVMLYRKNEDSLPYKSPPSYFDRTDATGKFEISNVASGRYKIFALLEKNSNYLFDNQDEEKIAFGDTLISPEWEIMLADTIIRDTLQNERIAKIGKLKQAYTFKSNQLKLKLFSELKEKQVLKKWTYEVGGKLQLVYNKPVQKLDYEFIKPLKACNWTSIEYLPGRDTVVFWLNDTISDSLFISLKPDTFKADSLSFSLKKAKKDSGKGGRFSKDKTSNETKHKFQLLAGNGGVLDLTSSLKILSQIPIRRTDFSNLKLLQKPDTLKPLEVEISTDSINQRIYSIKRKWKEKTTYTLEIPAGVIEDISGQKNDTLKLEFSTKANKDYGTLKATVTVAGGNPNFILQLIGEKGSVVQEKPLNNGKSQRFTFLNPGSYNIRLIDDQNRNGKWDTGRYLLHLQPEKVYIHPEKIEVKANWDLDLEWKIE